MTVQPSSTAIVGVTELGSRATLVTLRDTGVLLDRRTIDLIEPGLSSHPHHHEGSWAMGRYLNSPGARPLSLAEAVALVERVAASAGRGSTEALARLESEVHLPVTCIALRACPALPAAIEDRIADHRAQTMADSVMYRQALAAAATAKGWSVFWYDRARIQALERGPLSDVVQTMGRAAGPPWRAAHKLAATAALVAAGQHPAMPPRA